MTSLSSSRAWSASVIAAGDPAVPAPLFRREFALDQDHGAVARATLRVSALGLVEPRMNGQRISDDLLVPGWTSYEWRVQYATYEVGDLLERDNAIVLAAGNGWYHGRLAWTQERALYGERAGVIAQLDIRFADGWTQTIVTDESWSWSTGATIENDLYDGQRIDARLDPVGWDRPGFAEPWSEVDLLPFDTSKLEPYAGPPVRPQEGLRPSEIFLTPSGKTVIDFGQNIVGWVRVDARRPAGETILLRHAEVMENGELGTRPLRTARATDTFTFSGDDDVFEPTFTFHGFRYVEVNGWRGTRHELRGAVTAVVVGSQLRRTGFFRSSHALLNRLHENVVWGMRGNFVDLPTDCPQRDERAGWTGDIAVFAPTAAFLFDVKAFLSSWLRDLALEQEHNAGVVPYVVPNPLKYVEPSRLDIDPGGTTPTAVWADAAVWVPWALWETYGDIGLLAEHFPTMLAHVHAVEGCLSPEGIWDEGFQWGDWLDPAAPPDDPFASITDSGLIATLSAFRSTRLTAHAASSLGRVEDAVELGALADRILAGFRSRYVDGERLVSDTVTAYSLAIAFDAVQAPLREAFGDRLAELVAEDGFHISTGFVGTPFVTTALSATGHVDAAYRLLLQEECPSWLYAVTMGATTIWERWDSMLPDGTINPGEMTSFNHYAFGAVADWIHRAVGGIAPEEPGYRMVRVAPRPGVGIDWAETSLETASGAVAVSWRVEAERLDLTVDLPDGVRAIIDLPGRPEMTIGSGSHRSSHRLAPAVGERPSRTA
ncbi:family 78 glycoside hydrolase catalytic domain [Brachybacterium paraconglomeratum]|uniref:family 78 glycoside hydrolase catalytic domain n=1 Tax=Brachybacterium paraconglomeratum TaxID=173362 RepID=UPI003FD4D1BE